MSPDRSSGADRVELLATVVLAIATILTAWSAFQSSKWSGVQAIRFSEATAARTDSAKLASSGGQEVIVDVQTFTTWVTNLATEWAIDPQSSMAADGSYAPDPTKASGFIFERFRDEFEPAVAAWLALDPLENPDAAPTPFDLPEYQVAELEKSDRLASKAAERSQAARDANQRSDNYVLTTVLFAAVLFFAGVSTKLTARRNRLLALAFAVVLLVSGIVIVATFPIEI